MESSKFAFSDNLFLFVNLSYPKMLLKKEFGYTLSSKYSVLALRTWISDFLMSSNKISWGVFSNKASSGSKIYEAEIGD